MGFALCKSVGNFNRVQKSALVALTFGYISCFCPAFLLPPFFPPEAGRHNVTAGVTGMVFSLGALVGAVAGPFVGMTVAVTGPKVALIIASALGGVFSILFGLLEHIESQEWFVAGAFICQGLVALGGTIIYTSTLTYAAKIFPENMSLIIGTTETYIAISEIIALLLGGILHDLGGFQLPFLVFGSLHLLAIPLNMFLLPPDNPKELQSVITNVTIIPKPSEGDSSKETPTEGEGPDSGLPPTMNNIKPWHLLRIPRTMIMAMTVLTTGICWSFFSSTLEPHLAPLHLSATGTTALFLLSSVFYGLSSPLWGWVADKMSRTWILMTGGLLAGGLTFIFIGPLPIPGWENTLWHNIIMISLISITLSAAGIPACEACLLYTIEAGHPDDVATYAIVASLIATTYYAGATIGSFCAGFMMESVGYPFTAAIFGTIAGVWGIFSLTYFLFCYKPPKNWDGTESSSKRIQRIRNQSLSIIPEVDESSSFQAKFTNFENAENPVTLSVFSRDGHPNSHSERNTEINTSSRPSREDT